MVKPTKRQLEFMDWEFGVFFHFGIRTFYEGHVDWDEQEMPKEAFRPEKLDCRQWIRTAKEAGATYVVFVAKHHDGFANWPSKYTDYSVANVSWRNGQGDVVREFTDACREYDMKVGLYYSPAEFGSSKKNGREYDDYFINQISELLTGYGTIDYLWFDGCGSEGHQYDTVRIISAIRSMQPDILIFNMWDPDTRWVGNESGLAPAPNWNEVDRLDFSVLTDKKDALAEKKFLPAECDCKLRSSWFYQDADADSLKSLHQLLGMYEYSVGRGANFLLNIGPDRNGLVPEKDCVRLRELGEEIRRRYKSPAGRITNGIFETEQPLCVHQVILQEDLREGQGVKGFEIWAETELEDKPILVYAGSTIGHKAICKFPPVMTKKIRVKITKARPDVIPALADGFVFQD